MNGERVELWVRERDSYTLLERWKRIAPDAFAVDVDRRELTLKLTQDQVQLVARMLLGGNA